MKIVSLSPTLEPIFWEHVNQDLPNYYFFAHDWKYNRSDTKILLALKENCIDGMMLIFNERMVQLRGSPESGKVLLEKLDLEKATITALKHHKDYILEKYRPIWSHELMLMKLCKGEERLYTTHPIETLDTSDAEQIAAIMRKGDPEYWGEVAKEEIVEGMSNTTYFGIKLNGILISFGRARLTERVGHIPTVATHEAHRNKGYATSIVSYLAKLILEKTSTAIIYVLTDNPTAIRVYKKVGFKPYRKYYFIKGEIR